MPSHAKVEGPVSYSASVEGTYGAPVAPWFAGHRARGAG